MGLSRHVRNLALASNLRDHDRPASLVYHNRPGLGVFWSSGDVSIAVLEFAQTVAKSFERCDPQRRFWDERPKFTASRPVFRVLAGHRIGSRGDLDRDEYDRNESASSLDDHRINVSFVS
jgi:hypothetical protein